MSASFQSIVFLFELYFIHILGYAPKVGLSLPLWHACSLLEGTLQRINHELAAVCLV